MKSWLFLWGIFLICATASADFSTPRTASGSDPAPPPVPTRQSTGCLTDVRLDEGQGALAGLRVREQSGGTCAACAAADLIDAWGRSHEAPVGYSNREARASALLLAIEYAGQYQDGRVGGRTVGDVLAFGAENGTCNQVTLSRLGENYSPELRFNDFEGRAIPVYDFLWDEWRAVQDGKSTVDSSAEKISCRMRADLLQDGYRSLHDTVAALKRSSANEYFRDLFGEVCRKGNREHLQIPTAVVRPPFESKGSRPVASALNAVFDQGIRAQPVALTYCVDVLYEGSKYRAQEDDCTKHISTIVGRRWNALRLSCEYLIRNSWGTSCNPYAGSGLDCKNGSIWVPEHLVERAHITLTHVE